MSSYVYILSKNGTPLMPTTRYRHVRKMLDRGLAAPVKTRPFTIQLTYELKNAVVQAVTGGVDPGRTNIGLSAQTEGKCLELIHCTTRNKDIPKLMEERKSHRQASRSGARQKRKRRATKNGNIFLIFRQTAMGYRPMMTYSKKHGFRPVKTRMLPGCEKPSVMKDIVNKEAKFNNRRRCKGWLTPTVTQLLRTLIKLVEDQCKRLPIESYCVEMNKFTFMALDDPSIWKHKSDFQDGPLKGYGNVNDAVDAMQDNKCLLCGGPIEHHHHVVLKSEGGANTMDNIAGLCSSCHDKVHKDIKVKKELLKKSAGRNKKYGALSILNQVIPYFIEYLKGRFPGKVHISTGYETYEFRDVNEIKKDHSLDAYCIAMSIYDNHVPYIEESFPDVQEILQFRRQNRSIVRAQRERTYKYEGNIVAKNRGRRTAQTDTDKEKKQAFDSLKEWYEKQIKLYGAKEALTRLSRLEAVKSKRYYNNKDRIMPGSEFLYHGKRYILTGTLTNGEYFRAYGQGKRNFPASECKVVTQNKGLVYV